MIQITLLWNHSWGTPNSWPILISRAVSLQRSAKIVDDYCREATSIGHHRSIHRTSEIVVDNPMSMRKSMRKHIGNHWTSSIFWLILGFSIAMFGPAMDLCPFCRRVEIYVCIVIPSPCCCDNPPYVHPISKQFLGGYVFVSWGRDGPKENLSSSFEILNRTTSHDWLLMFLRPELGVGQSHAVDFFKPDTLMEGQLIVLTFVFITHNPKQRVIYFGGGYFNHQP